MVCSGEPPEKEKGERGWKVVHSRMGWGKSTRMFVWEGKEGRRDNSAVDVSGPLSSDVRPIDLKGGGDTQCNWC